MLLSNLLETIFHCHYKKMYLNYDLNKNKVERLTKGPKQSSQKQLRSSTPERGKH